MSSRDESQFHRELISLFGGSKREGTHAGLTVQSLSRCICVGQAKGPGQSIPILLATVQNSSYILHTQTRSVPINRIKFKVI